MARVGEGKEKEVLPFPLNNLVTDKGSVKFCLMILFSH